jgi:intracellular sulfur oxidation DsrE/DsrF family protein
MILIIGSEAKENDQEQQFVIFKPTGTILQADATIHVHVTVNMSHFKQHCEILTQTPKHKEDFFDGPPSIDRAYRANQRLQASICKEVDEMQGGTNTDRTSRQAMIAIGLGFLATAFGVYEEGKVRHLARDIKNLQRTAEHNIIIVAHQGAQLQQLEKHLQEQQADLQELTEQVIAHVQVDYQRNWLQERRLHLLEFADQVHRAGLGLHELRLGRLSPHLLSTQDARNVLLNLKQKSARLQGQPGIDHPDEIYQLPTTFLSNNPFQYQVFIHVPVVRQRLQLLQYRPFPIMVHDPNNTIIVEYNPTKRLLARND